MKVMSIIFWVLVIALAVFFIVWNLVQIIKRIKEKRNNKK